MQRFGRRLVVILSFSLIITPIPLAAQGYALDPDRVLTVTDAVAATGGTATVQVHFDHLQSGAFCHDSTSAWHIAVSHDAAVAQVVSVVLGSAVFEMLVGNEPDYASINIENEGWEASLITSLSATGPWLQFGLDLELYRATYLGLATGATLLEPCACTDWTLLILFFGTNCSDSEYTPSLEPGTLIIVAPSDFLRGDANSDGGLDLFDPILLLNWYFGTTVQLFCDDAADVNDNGILEGIADPIYLLTYLFAGGAAPPRPLSSCGPDPRPDDLVCSVYDCP
ncbi:MAG: hypothetical protein ACKVX7_16910 [Planctomycetota bacterium]